MRNVLLGIMVAVIGFLTACGGGSSSVTPPTPVLQSIQVTGASASLTAGQSQQMKAVGSYSNGSTQDLTATAAWSVSDSTLAAITSGGMLSTKTAGGSFSVTAKVGGVSGSFAMTVVPALISMSVTPASVSIARQTTQHFTATGTYSDGSSKNITGNVAWTSSNTSTATISNSTPTGGLAQALAAGGTT
ncbi:MAG TPA: Ig-like domain-containing protein, partial [Terriglobales bacterium]